MLKKFLFCAVVVMFLLVSFMPAFSSDVKIEGLVFTEGEEGPTRASTIFEPGETIYYSFTVVDYATDSDDKMWIIEDMAVEDDKGNELNKWEAFFEYHAEKPYEDGDYLPILNNIDIPTSVSGGEYKIHITIKDMISGESTELIKSFGISSSYSSEPGSVFSIENFVFTDGEDGAPKSISSYEAGESIFYSFTVVDFAVDDNGRVWIVEDMAVEDEKGNELNKWEDFFEYHDVVPYEDGVYLPIMNSIEIPEDVALGEYVIHIFIRDKISGKKIDVTNSFSVRPSRF